jgi:hypothetical protein
MLTLIIIGETIKITIGRYFMNHTGLRIVTTSVSVAFNLRAVLQRMNKVNGHAIPVSRHHDIMAYMKGTDPRILSPALDRDELSG